MDCGIKMKICADPTLLGTGTGNNEYASGALADANGWFGIVNTNTLRQNSEPRNVTAKCDDHRDPGGDDVSPSAALQLPDSRLSTISPESRLNNWGPVSARICFGTGGDWLYMVSDSRSFRYLATMAYDSTGFCGYC